VAGDDLARLGRAWLRFGTMDDGWFMVPSGEILCQLPAGQA
jgi:hypothetical protein